MYGYFELFCSKLNYKCPPKVHLLDLPLLDFMVTTESLNRKLKCFGLHTITIFKNMRDF